MTDDRFAHPRRSKAWLLGWLALTGPVLPILSVIVALASFNVWLYFAVSLLQIWVVFCIFLGVRAVITGVRDHRQPHPPSLATAGVIIGGIGAALALVQATVVIGSMRSLLLGG
jgi:hypothetical protein